MLANSQNRRCYSINEVKAMYGLGHTTIYKLINEGMLKTVKVGRRTLIPISALTELDEKLAQ